MKNACKDILLIIVQSEWLICSLSNFKVSGSRKTVLSPPKEHCLDSK